MAETRTLEHLESDVAALTVEALQRALDEQLVAVVLFGSRARGEVRDTSDWDLLIIATGLPERAFDRRLYLKQLLPVECRGIVSILARTPDEFTAHLSSLYLDIALDGRILYDPTGFAAQAMTSLKQLIRQTGLTRERTLAGDVWRWHTEPPAGWQLAWQR